MFDRQLKAVDVLLLDMNSTFMFGEDRFGAEQDYASTYRQLGGRALIGDIRGIVNAVIGYLEPLYPDFQYRESFPSIGSVLDELPSTRDLSDREHELIVNVIAEHECGVIPPDYADALRRLAGRYRLGLVADIWAPKDRWLDTFAGAGIDRCFEAMWFSSDHGVVKPSPRGFEYCLDAVNARPDTSLVIGDSVRRDLGGAQAAGLACLLVGGAEDPRAIGAVGNLLELV